MCSFRRPSWSPDSWFHPCLKEAVIDDYVWHCNRHTFCSWLAMNGASIKEIQVAAGHKVIVYSFDPLPGLRVGFYLSRDGAVIEFMEYAQSPF